MESYLHKQSKELLYSQIESTGQLVVKNGASNTKIYPLIEREDYRKECVLMEFPSVEGGYYPDECGCLSRAGCCCKANVGYRYKIKNGVCKCSACEHLDIKRVVIHDIAAFWKGDVRWAVEIINKHPPEWISYTKLDYPVVLLKAHDIMARVDNTPIFCEKIVYDGRIEWCDMDGY